MGRNAKTVGVLWLEVACSLRSVEHAHKQAQKQVNLDLPLVEAHVLYLLYRRDGQHPKDLALALGRTQTAFTPIINNLQSKKLVERRPNHRSGRSIFICLTPQGKLIEKALMSAIEDTEKALQENISDESQAEFFKMLFLLQIIHPQIRQTHDDKTP